MAKDVNAAQDSLIELFECIGYLLKRLEPYSEVRPSEAMTDIIIKIMIEVLNILSLATMQIKQGRLSEPPIRLDLYQFH